MPNGRRVWENRTLVANEKMGQHNSTKYMEGKKFMQKIKEKRLSKTHGFESMNNLWPTKRIHPKNGNPFFPTPKNEPKFVYEQGEEFKPAQNRKMKGRKRQKRKKKKKSRVLGIIC